MKKIKIKTFLSLTLFIVGAFVVLDFLSEPVFQYAKTGSYVAFKESLKNMYTVRRIIIDIVCSAAFSLFYLMIRKEKTR